MKLGARYVVVTSDSGFCEWLDVHYTWNCALLTHAIIVEGVIDKKHWVAFIGDLDGDTVS